MWRQRKRDGLHLPSQLRPRRQVHNARVAAKYAGEGKKDADAPFNHAHKTRGKTDRTHVGIVQGTPVFIGELPPDVVRWHWRAEFRRID